MPLRLWCLCVNRLDISEVHEAQYLSPGHLLHMLLYNYDVALQLFSAIIRGMIRQPASQVPVSQSPLSEMVELGDSPVMD